MRWMVVEDPGGKAVESFLIRRGGFTDEDFFRDAPEDRICEFSDGEIIMHSPAKPRHQRVVGFLTTLLRLHCALRRAGEILNGPAVLELRPGLFKEPDIFFVPAGELDRIVDDRVRGPVPFVIEVVSRGTRRYDRVEKRADYDAHGVGEYWIVDQDRREIVVCRRAGGAFEEALHTTGRLESRSLPGFWIEVDWLWQDPPPSEVDCWERLRA